MRIVAGKHRGRVLAVPEGRSVRPTSDRARQALFNILEHGRFAAAGSPFRGRAVLDAFAGTGALGLEALSRGADHVTFIEQAPAVRAILQANIRLLDPSGQTTLIASDVLHPPTAPRAHALALLDPPYGAGLGPPALVSLAARGWLEPGALAVLETAAREELAPIDGYTVEVERTYGAARLTFLRWRPQP